MEIKNISILLALLQKYCSRPKYCNNCAIAISITMLLVLAVIPVQCCDTVDWTPQQEGIMLVKYPLSLISKGVSFGSLWGPGVISGK